MRPLFTFVCISIFVIVLAAACGITQENPARTAQTQILPTQIISTSPVFIETFPPIRDYAEETHTPYVRITPATPFIVQTLALTTNLVDIVDIKHFTIEIINEFAHYPLAFTQGLIYYEGYFYESTGRYGSSSRRKVRVETGEILQQHDLPELFAEGITIFQNQIIQLTWKSNIGFVYDRDSFKEINHFHYNFEGWGITNDNDYLFISDGTETLYMLNPYDFEVVCTLNVTDKGQPVTNINELELVEGELYANIWQTTKIAIIDITTGEVTGWIELEGLFDKIDPEYQVDTLNGIAYDETNNRLFVTGKLWPLLFEIKLVPLAE
ncbi:MAG: glutaminyl-peptide cyclotransferase [Anaerolineaceae bacterium]|nr:glutaminyl-peptide cyclotransferase [Anaerolineaceae bacterium]